MWELSKHDLSGSCVINHMDSGGDSLNARPSVSKRVQTCPSVTSTWLAYHQMIAIDLPALCSSRLCVRLGPLVNTHPLRDGAQHMPLQNRDAAIKQSTPVDAVMRFMLNAPSEPSVC